MEQGQTNPHAVLGGIVAGSATAISFLLWLLYLHQASAQFAGHWTFLPALNVFLNGSSAIALCVGLYFIKHGDRQAHRTSMLLAFGFSSLFLGSYIVNHALQGDTHFPGQGAVRAIYLSILATCCDCVWITLLRGFSDAHGESAYPIMNLARIGPAITEN